MLNILHDLRYAARSLRKSWGFAVVAVLTLGLGVGANTAIFSVVNGVLLKPLGYTDPDVIVTLWHAGVDGSYNQSTTTPANFYAWQEQATLFDAVAAYSTTSRTVTGQGDPEQVVGVLSAGSIFDVLRVQPLLGRTFTGEEDVPGAEPVIVLSYALWERMFWLDDNVQGRSITLSGAPYTIVGVMPPSFRFPNAAAEYWIPAGFSEAFRGSRDQYFLTGLARLGEGVAIETAAAEMETIMGRLRMEYPRGNDNVAVEIIPLQEVVVGSVRTRLFILMGAVAFVLLIACANLANLLLARAQGRRREIALRQALGASRGRVLQQFLTESLGLAAVGSVAGVFLGWVLLQVLLALIAGTVPRLDDVGLDLSVLGFTVAVSLLAGFVFGIVPALSAAHDQSVESLKEGSRSTPGKHWGREALVVSEVALAMVLLTGAGLLIRSFWTLQRVDPGVTVERTLTFGTSLPGSRYPFETRVPFYERARERLAAIPGVTRVDLINSLPVTGRNVGAWFNILDRPVPADETPPAVPYRVVTPGFLETMGIPLVRGRYLTADDRLDGLRSVVINEELTERFFPGEDPVGREIYLGAPDNRLFESATIVGIVRNVHTGGLDAAQLSVVYVPYAVMPYWDFFSFVVRTVTEPEGVAMAVRATMRELDPELPITSMQSMEAVVAGTITGQRSSTILLTLFAVVALVMAVIGVFGVLSYTVSQRTRELGIRLALGANTLSVQGMVVSRGLAQVSIGVGVGVLGAFALTRLMDSMLFETSATDPLTFGAVALSLLAAGAVAAYLPALRASRADPMEVLKTE